jgi:glycosyltransferase involved in cell wall biosynthesis
VQQLQTDLFDDYIRSPRTSQRVQEIKDHLKDELHKFLKSFRLDLLIVENALSIPMHVPLGLALTELIAETCIPTLAHHHDFAWERGRFKVTAASDYQLGAFPPILPSVHHVVINSYAGRQLALRTGVSSTVVPNVMDFNTAPPEPDEYGARLRSALGIASDEFLLLQPTRVVPRKRIERAIELANRLEIPCTLVISHSSGDEGNEYEAYLRDYAELMGVRLLFGSHAFGHHREKLSDGSAVFSLRDAYQQSDLVTYPSTVEGFGNAFLECLYFRRPIVISTYEIYRRDIQPKGFRVIEFGEFVTEETVRRAREVIENPGLTAEMTEHNYKLGRRYYSYSVLENLLVGLLNTFGV